MPGVIPLKVLFSLLAHMNWSRFLESQAFRHVSGGFRTIKATLFIVSIEKTTTTKKKKKYLVNKAHPFNTSSKCFHAGEK